MPLQRPQLPLPGTGPKEARANLAGKALLNAVKVIDNALAVAQEQRADELIRALDASRGPLSEALVGMGARMMGGK